MKKTGIVIHCTDTPHTMDVTVDLLHKWHVVENGWAAIGYAYFIDKHGDEFKCRDLDGDGDVEDEIGAHTRGFNKHTIGVCIEGRGKYTDAQLDQLESLIDRIRSRHGIVIDQVKGHSDYDSSKTCPMFNVKEFMHRRG